MAFFLLKNAVDRICQANCLASRSFQFSKGFFKVFAVFYATSFWLKTFHWKKIKHKISHFYKWTIFEDLSCKRNHSFRNDRHSWDICQLAFCPKHALKNLEKEHFENVVEGTLFQNMFFFLTKFDDHCNRNWIKAYLTYKILFENSGLFQMESKVIGFLNVDYCLPILITRR